MKRVWTPDPTSWWLIISKRAVNFSQNFPAFGIIAYGFDNYFHLKLYKNGIIL